MPTSAPISDARKKRVYKFVCNDDFNPNSITFVKSWDSYACAVEDHSNLKQPQLSAICNGRSAVRGDGVHGHGDHMKHVLAGSCFLFYNDNTIPDNLRALLHTSSHGMDADDDADDDDADAEKSSNGGTVPTSQSPSLDQTTRPANLNDLVKGGTYWLNYANYEGWWKAVLTHCK